MLALSGEKAGGTSSSSRPSWSRPTSAARWSPAPRSRC